MSNAEERDEGIRIRDTIKEWKGFDGNRRTGQHSTVQYDGCLVVRL
jgi:hypothetical protein